MTQHRSRRPALLGAILAAGTLAACIGQSIDAHYRAWRNLGIHNYQFEYQRLCFCPGSGAWWRVTVKGDSAVNVQLVDTGSARRGLNYASQLPQPTIPDLFHDLTRDSRPALAQLHVEYNELWHFPSAMKVDPSPTTIDDEWELTVRNFRPWP